MLLKVANGNPNVVESWFILRQKPFDHIVAEEQQANTWSVI